MHRTLSSTGVLAVRAMTDLALQSRSAPVRLSVIGQRQGISKSYIDQMFGRLRRSGLVRATRGPGGGYSLGRAAEQISVADIVNAVDRSGIACVRGRKPRSARDSVGHCLTNELWDGLNAQLLEWLAAVSLRALVDERLATEAAAQAVVVVRGIAARAPVARVEVAAPHSVFTLAGTLATLAQCA